MAGRFCRLNVGTVKNIQVNYNNETPPLQAQANQSLVACENITNNSLSSEWAPFLRKSTRHPASLLFAHARDDRAHVLARHSRGRTHCADTWTRWFRIGGMPRPMPDTLRRHVELTCPRLKPLIRRTGTLESPAPQPLHIAMPFGVKPAGIKNEIKSPVRKSRTVWRISTYRWSATEAVGWRKHDGRHRLHPKADSRPWWGLQHQHQPLFGGRRGRWAARDSRNGDAWGPLGVNANTGAFDPRQVKLHGFPLPLKDISALQLLERVTLAFDHPKEIQYLIAPDLGGIVIVESARINIERTNGARVFTRAVKINPDVLAAMIAAGTLLPPPPGPAGPAAEPEPKARTLSEISAACHGKTPDEVTAFFGGKLPTPKGGRTYLWQDERVYDPISQTTHHGVLVTFGGPGKTVNKVAYIP